MSDSHRDRVRDLLDDAAADHARLMTQLPADLQASLPVDAQGVTQAIDYLAEAAGLSDNERRELIRPHAVNPAVRSEIFRLCLAYCEAGGLPAELRSRCTEPLLTSYDELAKQLRPLQKDQGIGWIWDNSYQDLRGDAGILLDIFGFLPDTRVEKSHNFIVIKSLPKQHHLIGALFVELTQPRVSFVRVHGTFAALTQRSSSR